MRRRRAALLGGAWACHPYCPDPGSTAPTTRAVSNPGKCGDGGAPPELGTRAALVLLMRQCRALGESRSNHATPRHGASYGRVVIGL
jgi:hypothetical protein